MAMPQTANRLRRQLNPSFVAVPRPGIAAVASEIAVACDLPLTAMGACIKAALARAALDPDLLAPEQRLTHSGCYARHVLHSDVGGRFTILAIVWAQGQFSPPH